MSDMTDNAEINSSDVVYRCCNQSITSCHVMIVTIKAVITDCRENANAALYAVRPVSYTHLTLPTNREV